MTSKIEQNTPSLQEDWLVKNDTDESLSDDKFDS